MEMSDFCDWKRGKNRFPSTVILGYASLKEKEIIQGCKTAGAGVDMIQKVIRTWKLTEKLGKNWK